MPSIDLNALVKAFAERIENEFLLCVVVVLVVAIWCGPAYIKAIGEVIRLGRTNKAELARKKQMFNNKARQQAKRIDRRRGHGGS